MILKTCSCCGQEKPFTEYYKHHNACKMCHRASVRDYHDRNREKINEERRANKHIERRRKRKQRERKLLLRTNIESVQRQIRAMSGDNHNRLLEAARRFENRKLERSPWFKPDWFLKAQGKAA